MSVLIVIDNSIQRLEQSLYYLKARESATNVLRRVEETQGRGKERAATEQSKI